MPKIAIIVEFEPRPECRAEFLDQLRIDAAETLRDEGCLRMEVLLVRDGERVILSELWRDDAAIEAHRGKPGHSHAWQAPLLKSKRVSVCETD
ncbi:MAG: antibiotic biosynthesis monooxygenase [Burkholderiales bacterium]|nr:antibiotic biosynthesis monooxygenase [Burkholderiales bacterium]